MTRVWLTGWEWGCCGDAFEVGDEVDLGIAARRPDTFLVELLGPDIAAMVDAVESHHEEDRTDRVRGRVRAVHVVTQDCVERRSLRRPGHGAPPDAEMPPEGEEWPARRWEIGNGVSMGVQPSRYVIDVSPVPGSARLIPVRSLDRSEHTGSAPSTPAGDPPRERRTRSRVGWLVDVEES